MNTDMDLVGIVQGVALGEDWAVARSISILEKQLAGYDLLAAKLAELPVIGWVVGITGSPGVGKSSLINSLAQTVLAAGKRVGILAFDPNSVFSGGGILGDRIRMKTAIELGAYVRSMGNEGVPGGLARSAEEVIKLIMRHSFDLVIVETVGTGQTELDVKWHADTVCLVLTPDGGDTMQAMKSGIMEIADILIVNKADKGGADRIAESAKSVLQGDKSDWIPPVLQVSTVTGNGIEDVWMKVQSHRKYRESVTKGQLEAPNSGYLPLKSFLNSMEALILADSELTTKLCRLSIPERMTLVKMLKASLVKEDCR